MAELSSDGLTRDRREIDIAWNCLCGCVLKRQRVPKQAKAAQRRNRKVRESRLKQAGQLCTVQHVSAADKR